MALEMKKVYSSNVNEIGYDEETKTLVVTFNQGTTYRYDNVPPEVGIAARDAASVGEAIARTIKGHYSYTNVG